MGEEKDLNGGHSRVQALGLRGRAIPPYTDPERDGQSFVHQLRADDHVPLQGGDLERVWIQ